MGNGDNPANLHETRKELAAAKRAHPAGKKAPAKAPAKRASIAWSPVGEKNERNEYDRSVGRFGDAEYLITRQPDGSFRASVKRGGKTTTLGEGLKSGRAAWAACVRHAKAAA
jgi:hypothetical protein